MITFRICVPIACFISLISSVILSYLLSFTSPRFTTISISEAPFLTASSASKIFVSFVLYPKGNPITVQMTRSLPYFSDTRFTYEGGIHTEAVLYRTASSHRFSISFQVVIALSAV